MVTYALPGILSPALSQYQLERGKCSEDRSMFQLSIVTETVVTKGNGDTSNELVMTSTLRTQHILKYDSSSFPCLHTASTHPEIFKGQRVFRLGRSH